MGFKCTPQLTGLVRGEPEKKQKHRSNGKAIALEMGEERFTSSVTYDSSRSHLNEYFHIDALKSNKGAEAWDYIKKRADDYRQTVKGKNGQEYSRSLRSNAVVGWGMIINPPEDECVDWTEEEYSKFYSDTLAIMEELHPMFSKKNVVFMSEHYDEGTCAEDRHVHIMGESIVEGRYCGNELDGLFLHNLNIQYPAKMRERGWDMDDLDVTDYERMRNDEQYRSERKRELKKKGLSVNKYISKKSAEKNRELLEQNIELSVQNKMLEDDMNTQRQQVIQEIQHLKDEAEEEAENIRQQAQIDAKRIEDEGFVTGYKKGHMKGYNKGIDEAAKDNKEFKTWQTVRRTAQKGNRIVQMNINEKQTGLSSSR